MLEVEVFGIYLCYSVIAKSFEHTQISKIKKLQLDILESMVNKYGIDSGYKSVPLAVVDFAIKAAE